MQALELVVQSSQQVADERPMRSRSRRKQPTRGRRGRPPKAAEGKLRGAACCKSQSLCWCLVIY